MTQRPRRIFHVALIFIGFFVSLWAAKFALANVPSVKIGTAPLVSPPSAFAIYGSSTTHHYHSEFGYGAGSSNSRPPELVELARALKGDPDLIFEYVRNTIGIEFSFGLQKGALGAIIDQSGTSFDQAHLLVELLRQAGHSARYKLGTISLSGAQFLAWSGLSNAKASCQFLAAGGIPATINGTSDSSCNYSGNVSTVDFAHVWVEVTIAGQNYVLDPSYKPHTHKSGVNLAGAMNYASGSAFTNVTGGNFTQGTEGQGVWAAKWVKEFQSFGFIKTAAQSLLTHLRANVPGALIDDVVGGSSIDRVVVPAGGFRSTQLPYSSAVSATWTGDIPNQYRTMFFASANDPSHFDTQVFGAGFYVDEVYGRRMRIETNFDWQTASLPSSPLWQPGGFRIWLSVDGVTVSIPYQTTIIQSVDRYKRQLKLNLYANHPFVANSNTYADQSINSEVYVAVPASIVHGWGDVSQNLLHKWSSEVADDKVAPRMGFNKVCSPSDQALNAIGCTTAWPGSASDFVHDRMAATWMGQFSMALDLNAQIAASKSQHHHSIGVVYSDQWSDVVNGTRDGGCSNDNCIWGMPDEVHVIDVSSTISLTHSTADPMTRRAAVYTAAALGAGLEGDVASQVLGIPQAASTTSRFVFANSRHVGGIAGYVGYDERISDPAYLDDIEPRRLYEFNILNVSAAAALLTFNGRTSNYPSGDAFSDVQAWKDALLRHLTSYSSAGYTIAASSEAFSGPGSLNGIEVHWGPDDDDDYRERSKVRGGGFVAVRLDGNGDPVDIAHIVTNMTGMRKGGGAGGPSGTLVALSADAASNLLKSRFADKSQALSVDLQTGKLLFGTGTVLSTGSGDLPYRLDAQLVYTGPGTQQASMWWPARQNAEQTFPTPYSGFTSNWDIRLSHFSDGFEAMGATSGEAAAGAIATIVIMQDVYRSGLSASTSHGWLVAQTAAPIAFTEWHAASDHNVAVVTQGGSHRKFLRAVDNSFVPPKGDVSVLTRTNQPTLRIPPCGDETWVDHLGGVHTIIPASTYDYNRLGAGVTFQLRNRGGDTIAFDRWESLKNCRLYGGWVAKTWSLPHGPLITLTYREGGQLEKVTSGASNRYLNFSQSMTAAPASPPLGAIVVSDTPNRIIPGNVRDDTNRQVNFEVGASNQIRHVNGGVTKLEYCPAVQRSTTQRPIPVPRLCRIYEPVNGTTAALEYTYDSVGRVKEVRDAVAIATPANRGPYRFYIAEGTRGEREDPVTPTAGRYVVNYDLHGRAIKHTDELGRSVLSEYDRFNRLMRRIYPEGDEERFQYDSRHNVTEFRRKAKPSSGLADMVVTATWDTTWSKPLSVTNAIGKTTSLTYVPAGSPGAGMVQQVIHPAAASGGAQPVFGFTYSGVGRGLLSTSTAPIGTSGGTILTSYDYDANGNRVRTIVDAGSGRLNLTTEAAFNQNGDVYRLRDPRGYLTEFSYWDASGTTMSSGGNTRLVAETKQSGNTSAAVLGTVTSWLSVGRKVYDLNGRAIRDEAPASITGSTYSWTNPLVLSTTTYSPTGKVVSVADASGDTTTTSYDALDRADVVTEPVGRKVKTVYDAAGQVTQIIRGFGSPLQQIYSTAVYSPNGQVLSVTDARGQITKSVYDGFDRLSKVLYPDATPANDNDNLYEQFTYDSGSRKLTERKRGGQVISFDYDDLDRVVSRSGGGLPVRSMTYDLGSRVTSVKDMNGATVVAETQYAFDTAGRLTQERRADWNLNVDYQYDANGNRTRLTWPDGFYASYVYDGLNRVTAVSSPTLSLKTFAYDHLSRRASAVTMPGASQTVTTFGYEPDNDLRYLTHNYPGTTVDLKYTHTYSASGRVLTSSASEALNRYVPPALHGTQTYASANPLNQYPSVTPIGGAAQIFAHDLNGNLTSDGATTFSYDATNRLLSIAGASSASYGYDALDRRVTKTVGAAVTRFLHAGGDEIADYSSAGALLRRYVPGPGTDERVAMIDSGLASPPATSITYPHTDRLGTVVAVTGSTGAVTQRFTYDAYGRSSSAATGYPFRYTGQRFDAESGLMFYKARVYSTSLGRFLQTDPIGTKDDMNMYAYVGNDPVNATDPSGKYDVSASLAMHNLCGVDAACQQAWMERQPTEIAGGLGVAGVITGLGYGAAALAPEILAGAGKFAEASMIGAEVAAPGAGLAAGGGVMLKSADELIESAFAVRAGAQLTGQFHHPISRTVHKALQGHPNLKGVYSVRDKRFVTQAKDLAAHRGYDKFHRNLDDEVSGWLRANPNATGAHFENYLRSVYQRPDVLERFPNGL